MAGKKACRDGIGSVPTKLYCRETSQLQLWSRCHVTSSEALNSFFIACKTGGCYYMCILLECFTVWVLPIQSPLVSGTNVYAILRAGRALGTESLILSAPHQSYNSNNSCGIAVMMALANYFRSELNTFSFVLKPIDIFLLSVCVLLIFS